MPLQRAEKELGLFNENAWDDCDGVDSFNVLRTRLENSDGLLRTEPSDQLSALLKIEGLVTEQKWDSFCQSVLKRQFNSKDNAFFEEQKDGLLQRNLCTSVLTRKSWCLSPSANIWSCSRIAVDL